jgi:hypothetical protein
MRLSWQLATAAVVGVLVIATGAVWLSGSSGGFGGPAATAPATPTPTIEVTPTPTARPAVGASPTAVTLGTSDLTATFRSPSHGYSVRYPEAWTVAPATKPWPRLPEPNVWGSGINDELRSGSVRFSAASQRLAQGETADAWYQANQPFSTTPRQDWKPVKIGGRTGWLTANGRSGLPVGGLGGTITPGSLYYDAVIVVDGRGYDFNMDGLVDYESFEAMLGSVTFEPSAAVDPTPSSNP